MEPRPKLATRQISLSGARKYSLPYMVSYRIVWDWWTDIVGIRTPLLGT